jgi:hypothetical protein
MRSYAVRRTVPPSAEIEQQIDRVGCRRSRERLEVEIPQGDE